jgi:hypothetical protein
VGSAQEVAELVIRTMSVKSALEMRIGAIFFTEVPLFLDAHQLESELYWDSIV